MSTSDSSASPASDTQEVEGPSSFLGSLWRWLTSPMVATLSGIVGPLTAFLGITVAVALSSSWFNWFNNALSDLGVSPAALFFNGGLIACGLLTLPFALRLTIILRGNHRLIGTASGLLLVASMLFLVGVGVFTEDAGDIHKIVSVIFFVTLLLSGIAAGSTLILNPSTRLYGALAVSLSLTSTAVWAIYWLLHPWGGVAIPEFISAITAYLWVAPLNIYLYRQAIPRR